MDLIAHDLELDPAEVRRRNFIPPDAFPYQAATGLTYDSGNYAQGMERALELLDYPHWRARARQRKPGEPLIGIGLATFLKSSGAAGDHRVESAEVTITPSGDIIIYTGISPHGQGSETSFAQIVADELGVHPAQVRVRHSDTALFPFGEGTSASRGLIVGGSAVYAVVQEARQRLAHLASELLACATEESLVHHEFVVAVLIQAFKTTAVAPNAMHPWRRIDCKLDPFGLEPARERQMRQVKQTQRLTRFRHADRRRG